MISEPHIPLLRNAEADRIREDAFTRSIVIGLSFNRQVIVFILDQLSVWIAKNLNIALD